MASDDKKKLVLRSSFEELEKLEPFIHELQEWASLSDDQRDRIMLPLSEAVNNAIIHGNKLQEDKDVTVVAELNDCHLAISVEDQGEGFDPGTIPDPLQEENLLNTGGRGVYLIKQYADDVDFSKNGAKVIMYFRMDD